MKIFFEKFLWFIIYLFLSVVTSLAIFYGLNFLIDKIFNVSLIEVESSISVLLGFLISIPVSIGWSNLLYDKLY